MYRELVEMQINRRGTIVPVGDIKPKFFSELRYCSLFMFGQDILPYVKTHKSVKEFKGKVYCEAVWIDIDYAPDVNAARLSAIEIVKRLNADYGIDPDNLVIYFSGNKGFHIAIYNGLVGFTHSTAILPEQMKSFVKRLTCDIAHVDFIIYEPVRIFRIENSRHEKSGLYKLRITFDELQCELDEIKQLAQKPREFHHKIAFNELTVKPKLQQLWQDCNSFTSEQHIAEAYDTAGNLFDAPTEGSRNKKLLVQACTLFRKSELSEYAILDIISNAAFISNINATEKVDDRELKTIVANAKRLVGAERKVAKQDELQIKSFGEWVPEWEAHTLQEQTQMTLCFSDLNRLLKGRLKGQLGVIMGYGGSKKSLYALNVCLRNMRENNDIAIYSTMEMSVPRLMDRIIDHEVQPNVHGLNASTAIANVYKRDVNEGRRILIDQLSKDLGNKMQIIPNSRMTYEYYKIAIQKVKETTGKPSILVVDGLSMMGGKGTETELYSQNSADLKQLAIEENMLILLICHVSKGLEKNTRDLSGKIRGSEKILDNCDFYMTMSQIESDENPAIYNQNKGFISFNDKRGTGQIADIVFDFDPQRLKLIESGEDPKPYYESKRKAKYLESDF